MMTFTDALKSADLSAIRSFPKSDLHNHFVLGGNREYLMNIPGASTKVSTGHFTRAQRGRGITSLCSTDYD